MRLWHYELIKYLPRQQLLAQWRELNSIFVKQNKHILINYVYEYPKKDLCLYANMVNKEMRERGYFTYKMEAYKEYFKEEPFIAISIYPPFKNHHTDEYLKICCWNLYEKFIRGQKGFTDEAISFIKENISRL